MATKPKKDVITPFIINPKGELNAETLEPSISEELQLKIIEEVFSKQDIQLKTDLTSRQIAAFARAKLYYEKYNVPMIGKLLQDMSEWLVSKDRKGRKEFTDIAKAFSSSFGSEVEPPSPMGRLLGKERL